MKPTPWPAPLKITGRLACDAIGVPILTTVTREEDPEDAPTLALAVAGYNALFKIRPDATVEEYEALASQIGAMVGEHKRVARLRECNCGMSRCRTLKIGIKISRAILDSAGIEWREA